ncbi:MAG: hypothetical protein AAGI71_10705 [Bacteroidota bacterium]
MATVKSNGFLKAFTNPYAPTRDLAESGYQFTGGNRGMSMAYGAGFIGLAVGIAGALASKEGMQQLYMAYLVGWTFCVAIALGCLFFVIIQHLTKAHWSVTVRRIAEAMAYSFPVLALMGIPILFGLHDIYEWTHTELFADPEAPTYDYLIAGKRPYLNEPFFIGRMVFYFAIWSYLAYRLYTLSLRQDVEADPTIPAQQRKVSAWGLPVYAVTLSFFSYDALMSTYPHWFSSIFGVYYFTGGFFSALAFIILAALFLQRRGQMLHNAINVEHYHDLGKFLFSFFAAFWAYIAFSQYMLIWYAGIPEETVWYRYRLSNGWEYHSYALIAFHFVLPFLILLPRAAKRTLTLLGIMAVWALFMNFFDLHYIVMPVLHAKYGVFDFTALGFTVGLFGIMTGLFIQRLRAHALVPYNDPRLAKSLHFENV